VSYERIVSGPGLEAVYEFFSERHRRGAASEPEPVALGSARREGRLAATVSELALQGADPAAVKSLDLFVSVYGAEASNLALKGMATGGVYLGGGIAPKLLRKLEDGSFVRAFRDKGRLSAVLEKMPVHVIVNERTSLLGAARYAVSGRLV
jgi:glucokinase